MSESTNIIREMISRLLAEGVTAPLLEAAERGDWAAPLWAQLEETGLPTMLAGSDVETTWREAFPVIEAAGQHALPLPLPEVIAANYILDQAGIESPSGVVGLAGFHPQDTLSLTRNSDGWRVEGQAHRVPWGRFLNTAVAIIDTQIALLTLESCAVTKGANLVGEPRDTLAFQGFAIAVADVPAGLNIQDLGAAIRSAQMAGAIAALLERSVSYASERKQFARPIGNFQAIQHQLAVLAEESATATLAAKCAFSALYGEGDIGFSVAVAKIRCGEAAGKACSIAHQVHGAMGFAYETSLHQITRRLLAWRAEFGAEGDWALKLASSVVPHGGDGLWPFVVQSQKGASS